MNAHIYSQIASYLKYQRDIGVDELVFEHGSNLRKTLFVRSEKPNVATLQRRAPAYNAPRVTFPQKTFEPPQSANPTAKLSGLTMAGDLGLTRAKIPAPQTKVNSPKRDKLGVLYREAKDCGKCAQMSKVVFGTGSADGHLLIVGASPSAQDEAALRPFQDEAGKLLDSILDKLRLDKTKDVFMTYVQKCSHGGGFDLQYAQKCKTLFDEQIKIIEPKTILIFGEAAANFLFNSNHGIEQLRSAKESYLNIPVIVTYDLQLLLDEPTYRTKAWADVSSLAAT